jgi:hypothetical protein
LLCFWVDADCLDRMCLELFACFCLDFACLEVLCFCRKLA